MRRRVLVAGLALGLIGLAILAAAVRAAEPTPAVTGHEAWTFARQVAANMTPQAAVSSCERRSRYYVRCRLELSGERHAWAVVHAHNGFVYWLIPTRSWADR